MQETDVARIAEEDQKMIRDVQVIFQKKVAQDDADYRKSVHRQLAEGRAKSQKSPVADRTRE